MKEAIPETQCAYCSRIGADERDHVIARQFFPPEQIYRGNLPRVPSCGCCNRKKQRVEDGTAVLFQFCDGSKASQYVLTERVPKTLAKNKRLHASLQQSLREIFVRFPSGIVVPALGINLSLRELSDIYVWFQYVTKGLYYFEFNKTLPSEHGVHLLRPIDERFNFFAELILQDKNHHKRSFSDGELKYTFVSNQIEEISLWFYEFKSINMFALTLPPACPSGMKLSIAKIEWPPPKEVST